jgi:phosphatidylserine decarboxylase
MVGMLGELVKSKEGKMVLIAVGGTIAALTIINYFHQIKLTKLKINEIENK